jgi:hypothetical protein
MQWMQSVRGDMPIRCPDAESGEKKAADCLVSRRVLVLRHLRPRMQTPRRYNDATSSESEHICNLEAQSNWREFSARNAQPTASQHQAACQMRLKQDSVHPIHVGAMGPGMCDRRHVCEGGVCRRGRRPGDLAAQPGLSRHPARPGRSASV